MRSLVPGRDFRRSLNSGNHQTKTKKKPQRHTRQSSLLPLSHRRLQRRPTAFPLQRLVHAPVHQRPTCQERRPCCPAQSPGCTEAGPGRRQRAGWGRGTAAAPWGRVGERRHLGGRLGCCRAQAGPPRPFPSG